MATILLTTTNIDFVKSQLRDQFPQIKSTHLTEAIASYAGFRTHAALIAACKAAPFDLPNIVILSETRFLHRLQELGCPIFDGCDVNEICRSSSLPLKMWVAFRNGDRDANNRWFQECRRRNIPNVCIRTRRKYVELYWDCVSIDPKCESHVQGKHGSDLVQEMFDTFQAIAKSAKGKPIFMGNSFTGSIDRLLPELASELADKYFALLYEPMRKQLLAA